MENINNVNAVDTKEIDLLELVMVVWKKVWIPILVAICCVVLMFGFCEFIMAPEYTSETKLYVATMLSKTDVGSKNRLIRFFIRLLQVYSALPPGSFLISFR